MIARPTRRGAMLPPVAVDPRSANVTPLVKNDDAEWTTRIRGAWNRARDSIFEVGRLLLDAKADLPHGSFTRMIEEKLPFNRQTAFRLMTIASDDRLTNVAHAQHLPPSWATLYELSKLSDARLSEMFARGEIHTDMQRKDIARADVNASKRTTARPMPPEAPTKAKTEIELLAMKHAHRVAVGRTANELRDYLCAFTARLGDIIKDRARKSP